MNMLRHPVVVALAVTAALSGGLPARAAIKIRQPVLDSTPGPGRSGGAPTLPGDAAGDEFFVGAVVFARGNQVVAELPRGARLGERMVIYDASLRRKGKALVEKALDDSVYLLRPVTGGGVAAGDRLARESELEAASRVVRSRDAAAIREFLDLFPDSQYRERMARELFRLKMQAAYPTYPGTVIEGKLTLAEPIDRPLALSQVLILLDRFVIARSDDKGRFRIEGMPELSEPVAVQMRIKDARFETAEPLTLELPATGFEEIAAEVPVRVAPTVLAGRVVDARGIAVPGAEVWTFPYTMEVLTDSSGEYKIARRKVVDASGAVGAEDRPLFGGDFEVYAYRRGYSVGQVQLVAESYTENRADPVRIERQDARREVLPGLGVDLLSSLDAAPIDLGAPQAGGPKLNR